MGKVIERVMCDINVLNFFKAMKKWNVKNEKNEDLEKVVEKLKIVKGKKKSV